MKKNIIKIIIIFLFLTFTPSVLARTNEGMLFEEYYETSKVNVFAESSTGTMDYNGWMIKSNKNSKIYYCIEPEVYMQNKEEASSGTHNIYEGKTNIIKNSRLNNTTYKIINLLAYYGYGYKNHTDKKWYGITQVLIWQELKPSITWKFKTSRYGSVDTNLYKKEVNELKNLVKNHEKAPSFSKSNNKLLLKETKILEDKNKVLENYTITKDNDNIDIKNENNKLIITAKNEGTTSITLTKKSNTGSNFTLFSGSSLQDIITRGEVDDVKTTLLIEVEKGELTMSKIDGDNKNKTPLGDATLKGAHYGIYDENKTLIEEVVFDDTLTHNTTLPYGTYYIKELIAPPGYKLDEKEYKISLDSNNKKVSLTLEDYCLKARYTIYKEKGGSGEHLEKEPNAKFKITNKSNTFNEIITTNEEGMASIILPYGTYTITQIEGTPGYQYITPYEITIDDETPQTITLKNLKLSKIIFKKEDKDSKKLLPNTKIALYKEDNTLIFTGTTNKEGKIEIPNIEIGNYYIKEQVAPPGYIIDYTPLKFRVEKDGEELTITMKNKKFTMPDTTKEKTNPYKIALTTILLITIAKGIIYERKNN